MIADVLSRIFVTLSAIIDFYVPGAHTSIHFGTPARRGQRGHSQEVTRTLAFPLRLDVQVLAAHTVCFNPPVLVGAFPQFSLHGTSPSVISGIPQAGTNHDAHRFYKPS